MKYIATLNHSKKDKFWYGQDLSLFNNSMFQDKNGFS